MAYQKNIWQTGDIITAEKLNNIEEGIDNVTKLDSNDYFVSTIFPSIYMDIMNLEGDSSGFNVRKTFSDVPEEEILKIFKIKNFEVNIINPAEAEVSFYFNLLSSVDAVEKNNEKSVTKLYSYIEKDFSNFYFLQMSASLSSQSITTEITKIVRHNSST